MRYAIKIALGLYAVVVIVLVYWVLDRQVLYGNDFAGWTAIGVLVLLHLVVGAAVNRWWALVLPLLAVAIAAPLGYPASNRGEPLPIWASLLYFAPVGVALLAIGIGARRLGRRAGSS